MRNKLATSLFFLSLVLLVSWSATIAGLAETSPTSGIRLERLIDNSEPLPGESVAIRFELINHETEEVGFTLIEEVPMDVALLDTGDGIYHETAGFIVWRGTLSSGDHLTIPYALQVQATDGLLPLYAYMSTTRGDVLDHADQLLIEQLDWQVSLSDTLVQEGDTTTLRLRVNNPLDRALAIDFSFEIPRDLQLDEAFPTSVHLAAGDEWTFETVIAALAVGRHVMTVTPHIDGVALASPKRLTLTRFDGERPRFEYETDDDGAGESQPITTERVHQVRLPAHLLKEDEELILLARLPKGAGYVPGSARLGDESDDEPVTPQLRGDHLVFPIPLAEHVTLKYALRYEDRSILEKHVPNAYDDVGLISMGLSPRVLRGDEQLLIALHGERSFEPRDRVGAVILAPFDGQIFTEREQIDIEVDGPAGSEMTLSVNGAIVSRDQIGGIAEETTRLAEKYVAIPLSVGANHLDLVVVTAEGEELEDRITVYRSGPVTRLTITPVSDMVIGGIYPLLIQVTATDENGLAPADGTPITVEVSGGKLLSPDSHPDWVGHQVLLYGGRALLQIESPAEAGMISIAARTGEVVEETALTVTARADDWFLLALGTLRAEGLANPQGTQPTTSSDLRLVARGPVGRGVFTASIDTRANTSITDDNPLWTGDTSSSGHLVGSGDPVHLQFERGLSYVRYGSGRVEFAGELARYNRIHKGLQSVVRESPRFSLHSFIDSEPMGRLQEIIEGDGTGYYRLAAVAIQPNSEDVAIVVREPFFPYEILSERGLARSEYTMDYLTGQIWLREPLLSRDADGHRLSLRIRYNPVGEPMRRGVGGLQATWHLERGHISGTARLALDPYGEATRLFVLGGQQVGDHDVTLDWEVAAARDEHVSAPAYLVRLSHPNALGWNVRLLHRHVHSDVAAVVDGLQAEVVTSFAGERKVQAARWTARATVSQDSVGAPWTAESQIEVDWSWRRLRPSLGMKVERGLAKSSVTKLRAGLGYSMPVGSIGFNREVPIDGEHTIHDVVDGRVNLARGLDLLFSVDRETDSSGQTESRNAISMTKSLEGAVASTILKGGYEYSDIYEHEEAMVYSAISRWPINDAHSLQLGVDHRVPLKDDALPSFGGQLGWTYRHRGGESAFRFDHRTDGSSLKQAIQWRGFQPLNDALALQVDASLVRDGYEHTGTRVGISAAYRTDRSSLLASSMTETRMSPIGGSRSSEWRVKGAHYLTPDVLLNLGYAQRVTDAPTVTDKLGLSLIARFSDRYDLVFDGSLLRQHDSGTHLLGGRIGVGYHLTDEMSIILGYAAADYVGFDLAGVGFAKRRSGMFVELNLAFDELSVADWFKR